LPGLRTTAVGVAQNSESAWLLRPSLAKSLLPESEVVGGGSTTGGTTTGTGASGGGVTLVFDSIQSDLPVV
jgi:hypothetical protein